MSESIGKLPSMAKEKAKRVFREQLAPKVLAAFSAPNIKTIHQFSLKHLEDLGIQPKFIQEGNPQFDDMRSRLNTESGVIICNHPGWGDTFEILSVLRRDDLKIMMEKDFLDLLPPEIADRYFFPNEKDPSKTITVFKKIQDHIRSGGVLLIYPSGGNEEEEGTSFKDGFRVILRGLKPEQMVYCFNINDDDTANIDPHTPRIFLASEVLLRSHLDVKKAPQTVRVDEAYTQAGEWQRTIESTPKDEAKRVLTRKYEGMFSSKK